MIELLHGYFNLDYNYGELALCHKRRYHTGPIDMQMETDASTTGWGVCITGTNQLSYTPALSYTQLNQYKLTDNDSQNYST